MVSTLLENLSRCCFYFVLCLCWCKIIFFILIFLESLDPLRFRTVNVIQSLEGGMSFASEIPVLYACFLVFQSTKMPEILPLELWDAILS